MQHDVSDGERIERAAAREISRFMQSEFGLAPGRAEARLHDTELTVRLDHSLTSLGEMILRAAPDEGTEAIESFYGAAHARCHPRLEALVTGIIGAAVPRSVMELDVQTGSLLLTFFFAAA